MLKVLRVITAVLFFALLPWPVYITAIYMNFSSSVRTALSIALFSFEAALGLLNVAWGFVAALKEKKPGQVVLLAAVCAAFLGYAASLLNTYVFKFF